MGFVSGLLRCHVGDVPRDDDGGREGVGNQGEGGGGEAQRRRCHGVALVFFLAQVQRQVAAQGVSFAVGGGGGVVDAVDGDGEAVFAAAVALRCGKQSLGADEGAVLFAGVFVEEFDVGGEQAVGRVGDERDQRAFQGVAQFHGSCFLFG